MSENKSFDELLLPVRNDIDRIDKELLKLFTERMHCAERVAEIKRKAGIPVLNAAREQVILDRVKKEAGEYGDSAVALQSRPPAQYAEKRRGIARPRAKFPKDIKS